MPRTKKPDDFIPEELFPEDHFHFGKPRCSAWNPNQGRQCLAIAIHGTGKCRVHGGSHKKGIEHHAYKDGSRSRYSPKLPSKYPKYLLDPNYLSLGDEMALVTARIDELVDGLDIGESSRLWKEAKKEFSKLRRAIKDQDVDGVNSSLQELQTILFAGNKAWAKWDEIEKMIESRRKLADTERKRVEAAQQSLRSNQAIQLFQSMVFANREVIKSIENEIHPEDIELQDGIVVISTKAKNRILEKIGVNFRTYVDQSNIQSANKTD